MAACGGDYIDSIAAFGFYKSQFDSAAWDSKVAVDFFSHVARSEPIALSAQRRSLFAYLVAFGDEQVEAEISGRLETAAEPGEMLSSSWLSVALLPIIEYLSVRESVITNYYQLSAHGKSAMIKAYIECALDYGSIAPAILDLPDTYRHSCHPRRSPPAPSSPVLWTYRENAVPLDLAKRCIESVHPFTNHVPEAASRMRPNAMDIKTGADGQPLRPPLFAFYSDPEGASYQYFVTTVYGRPFSREHRTLAQIAVELVQRWVDPNFDMPFDAAFVNMYRDGHDHVPHHRDMTHGAEYCIVSFSFYEDLEQTATDDLRSLVIRDSCRPALANANAATTASSVVLPITESVLLMHHASAVIMHVGMQDASTHAVLPTASKKYRYNYTFRVGRTLSDSLQV